MKQMSSQRNRCRSLSPSRGSFARSARTGTAGRSRRRRPAPGATRRMRNSSISARRMENAEGCLLRSSSGNKAGSGFKCPTQRAVFVGESLPMRMRREHRLQHLREAASPRGLSGRILDVAAVGDDFERRAARRCPSANSVPEIRSRRRDRSRAACRVFSAARSAHD